MFIHECFAEVLAGDRACDGIDHGDMSLNGLSKWYINIRKEKTLPKS